MAHETDTQQWITLYTAWTGPYALQPADYVRLLGPWAEGRLSSPQMPSVYNAQPAMRPDPAGGFLITAGPYAGREAWAPWVTAMKWNLRLRPSVGLVVLEDPTGGPALGQLRDSYRKTISRALRGSGFSALQTISLMPAGRPLSADRGVPLTPSVPVAPAHPEPTPPEPRPEPRPEPPPLVAKRRTKVPPLAWWALGALGLGGVAVASKRFGG